MAETTGIEWCDHTWSPWIGCTRISAACDHCYAADYGRRFGVPFETGAPRRRTSAEYWKQPPRWNRQAEGTGRIATVFPSLCDPFDSEVDPAWLGEMLALFAPLTSLRLLLLTKRPHLAAKYFDGRNVPNNVALGITAEDQKMLDLRGPQILSVRARWHFLSAEPLLGGMDAYNGDVDPRLGGIAATHTLLGHWWEPNEPRGHPGHFGFGWVIAGGESGPKARPSHPDWFRSLRDQCAAAEVPFFFKQWGEWEPRAEWSRHLGGGRFEPMVAIMPDGSGCPYDVTPQDVGAHRMARVGKKAAGATLDGCEHREFPEWHAA